VHQEFQQMEHNDDNVIALGRYLRVKEQRNKKLQALNIDKGISSGSFLVIRAVIKLLAKVKLRRQEKLKAAELAEQNNEKSNEKSIEN